MLIIPFLSPHLKLLIQSAKGFAKLEYHIAGEKGFKPMFACRYVAGRPLGDCAKDFEPGMGLVWLSENAASRTITARYAILASQTASWRPGFGCMLEPWKD